MSAGKVYLPKNLSALALSTLQKKVQMGTASNDDAALFATVMSVDLTKRTLSPSELEAWGKATEQVERSQTLRNQQESQIDPGRVPEKNQHNRWDSHKDGPDEI